MEKNLQLSKIASRIIAAVVSLALLLFSLLVVTSKAFATDVIPGADTPTPTPTIPPILLTLTAVLSTPIVTPTVTSTVTPTPTPTDTPTPTPHPKHKATPTPTPVPANNSIFGTSSDTPTPTPTPEDTPTPVDTATPDTSPTPTFTAVPVAAQHGSTPPGNQANRRLPSPLILVGLGLGVLISLGVLVGLGWLLLRRYFAPAPQVTMPLSGAQPWGLQQHEDPYGNPGGFPFAASGQNMPSNGPFPPTPGGYPPMNAPQVPFPSTNDWFRPPNEP